MMYFVLYLVFFYYCFLCWLFFFFFFFSSRRRHTRSKRDWSSDVCSSDLPDLHFDQALERFFVNGAVVKRCDNGSVGSREHGRSEERRVGKECRSRWWRYH